MLIFSLSSKAPNVNNGGGNESQLEDGSVPWRDGVDGERQRDSESREADVSDGTSAAAEINHHHKGSADKNKFGTVGYQASDFRQKLHLQWWTLIKYSFELFYFSTSILCNFILSLH